MKNLCNVTISSIPVHQYLGMISDKRISLGVDIQRGADKWDSKQKSKLIASIINQDMIPPIATVIYKNKKCVIDGLQRTTAICQFSDNEFALEGVGGELEGKRYFDLAETDRKKFDYREIHVLSQGVVDEDKMEELFLNLNNGTPLNKTQKTRAYLGGTVAAWADEMCKHPLFTLYASFTNRQIQDDGIFESLIQGLLLIEGMIPDSNGEVYGWKNISKDEVQRFGKEVLSKTEADKLKEYKAVIEYLDTMEFVNEYKKTFIPALILLAKCAIDANVPTEVFEGYITIFMKKKPKAYTSNMGSSNISRKQTIGRVKALFEDFTRHNPKYKLATLVLNDTLKGVKTRTIPVEDVAPVVETSAVAVDTNNDDEAWGIVPEVATTNEADKVSENVEEPVVDTETVNVVAGSVEDENSSTESNDMSVASEDAQEVQDTVDTTSNETDAETTSNAVMIPVEDLEMESEGNGNEVAVATEEVA